MEALKQKDKKLFSITIAKKIIIFLIVVLIFDFFLFAAPALASEQNNNLVNLDEENTEDVVLINNNLPENLNLEVKQTVYKTATAYNSDIYQCDSTPCITANGFNVCKHGIEDTIAANFLPFGTKVRIPDKFGDRVFIVRDRMNKRYTDRIDIWMLNKQDAKQFGVRVVKIEILGH